jgi:hypothetical protein
MRTSREIIADVAEAQGWTKAFSPAPEVDEFIQLHGGNTLRIVVVFRGDGKVSTATRRINNVTPQWIRGGRDAIIRWLDAWGDGA